MKGKVRNPTTLWVLVIVTCGLYGLYWYFIVGRELKNYLGNDELNPALDVLFCALCFVYVYYLPIKYGKLIHEAQVKAGITDAENRGLMFLLFMFLFGFGFAKMQEGFNHIWEA